MLYWFQNKQAYGGHTMKHLKGHKNIWLDGIMGVVIGDAIGLPVQFLEREELAENPLEDMIGYGTFYLPEGSWSDDSSLTLATLDSLRECNEIDCDDIMKRFVEWLICPTLCPLLS